MSSQLILEVWRNCPEGRAPLAMLMAIAEAANEQGNCYLTLSQLACAARVARKTALGAVRHLRDQRWIVTSRILGQGGTLVYQLNLPKLGRSRRQRHDALAVEAQRSRQTGATEAGLLERVQLRKVEGENCTASESGKGALRVAKARPENASNVQLAMGEGSRKGGTRQALATHQPRMRQGGGSDAD